MPIANEPNILRSTLFLLLVLLAAGCVTMNPNPPEQGIVSDALLDKNEGIVFGTLGPGDPKHDAALGNKYFIHYGPKRDPWDTSSFESWMLQGHTLYPVFFAKRLPVGEYQLYRLTLGNGAASVGARFTVASNKATYIGSLQVAFRDSPGILGGTNTRVVMRATNELDNALQQYKQRNPRLPYEITTNLMKF